MLVCKRRGKRGLCKSPIDLLKALPSRNFYIPVWFETVFCSLCFSFNSMFYQQMHVVAMGTKTGSSSTNHCFLVMESSKSLMCTFVVKLTSSIFNTEERIPLMLFFITHSIWHKIGYFYKFLKSCNQFWKPPLLFLYPCLFHSDATKNFRALLLEVFY